MTPHERLNAIAETLGIAEKITPDSGILARDTLTTKIMLELAERTVTLERKRQVLTLPGKK